MKKTNKIISALLSIVFIAAFSITSNDSIPVFRNISMSQMEKKKPLFPILHTMATVM